MNMEDKKKISILALLGLILGGSFLYIIFADMANIEETETIPTEQLSATGGEQGENSKKDAETGSSDASPEDQSAEFVSEKLTLVMWPDAENIDAGKKAFTATVLTADEAGTFEKGQEISITTDGATRFYKIVNKTPAAGDYFDFAKFKTLMETWEGPDWRFTLKGATQKDGSILASEVFYQIQ